MFDIMGLVNLVVFFIDNFIVMMEVRFESWMFLLKISEDTNQLSYKILAKLDVYWYEVVKRLCNALFENIMKFISIFMCNTVLKCVMRAKMAQ